MSLTVDNDLPAPETNTRKQPVRSAIEGLEVGQSVFVPLNEAERHKTHSAAFNVRRALGYTLTCKGQVENGVAGVRVWRTS